MTTLSAGSSVTLSVGDNGTVSIATNGGLASAVITPTVGSQSVIAIGPQPERRKLGPFAEGASVTLSNSTVGAFDYDYTAGDSAAVQALVAGAGNVATSRAALATDSGATLELAAGVTYTIGADVALPGGVAFLGPASGSATIACTGGATLNGGTSSVTVAAGKMATAVPRASTSTAYLVAVQA